MTGRIVAYYSCDQDTRLQTNDVQRHVGSSAGNSAPFFYRDDGNGRLRGDAPDISVHILVEHEVTDDKNLDVAEAALWH